MGVWLEPTPEMGTWSVEVFTGSACFRNAAPADCVDGSGVEVPTPGPLLNAELPPLDCGGRPAAFEVPIRELRPVIAAVDQVLAEPLYFDHVQHGDLDLGCWNEAVSEGSWLRVPGPVLESVVRVGYRSIEVLYSHVAELRYHLVDFLNRSCSDDFM
ncbi:hypothetical protein [Amycolatopsis sp. CA-128772]|uniref:hypothetical protein n=1 Tax=Amycolatopsis sp. CA-128772 TaxID=2073159 RepID=UPI000CD041C4|nr:hypothetical protein [Amycolatopsis sp. CA-128772]